MDHDDTAPEALRLRAAALEMVDGTAEGQALRAKLEAFETLDAAARKKAARDIQDDLADIVARAVTETNQRAALLEALTTYNNDQTLTEAAPAEIEAKHPLAVQALDVAQEVLVELGKEALIEAVLPGAHILIPPTDFVQSVFATVELLEIAEDDGPWAWP